jgi:periodic tryptophan protein 2
MNFRFHNLLGAPYRGGTLALHGDVLLSPVGNRVAQVRGRDEKRKKAVAAAAGSMRPGGTRRLRWTIADSPPSDPPWSTSWTWATYQKGWMPLTRRRWPCRGVHAHAAAAVFFFLPFLAALLLTTFPHRHSKHTNTQVDLVASTSSTLPFETLHQTRTLAIDPAGRTLVAIDATGRGLIIALAARALLGHASFGGPVPAAAFSPDGRFLAVAVGRLVQVWRAPPRAKTVAPLALHRTYGQAAGTITCVAWSPDGRWVAAGSKDLTVRVWSVDPVPPGHAPDGGFKPPVLAGHKDDPVAVFWAGTAAGAGGEAGRAAAEAAAASALGADPAAAAPTLYSISRDGALFAWAFTPDDEGRGGVGEGGGLPGWDEGDGSGGGAKTASPSASASPWAYARGRWRLVAKHFFNQRGARVTCAAHHAGAGLVAAGMSSGAFDLRTLPSFAPVHALSASKGPLSSLAFNARGDWLALGAAQHGQLCAWEWRAEAYVLRQQGHAFAAAAAAFSPDGGLLATGADDAKVKLWGVASGFCHVTLGGSGGNPRPAGAEGEGTTAPSTHSPGHTAPITGLAFLPSSGALLSSSRDGTVRAWDLARYRCFRTLVPPERAQLGCVAADAGSGGDIVAAGGADTFSVYVWSVRTSRVLDVLAGHEGPVSCLAFSPAVGAHSGGAALGAVESGNGGGMPGQGRANGGAPLLASGSWDKSVRLWDVFGGKGAVESLPHAHEVLALAWHPAGHTLAVSTLDGTVSFWDPAAAVLRGTIEARRDVLAGAGAGPAGDLRSAANTAASAAFTSLAYSADGAFLVGGGAGAVVCVYDAEERVLLRRLATTTNRSLGGVRSAAGAHHSSGHLTDAGPRASLPDGVSDDEDGLLPASIPGGAAGASGLPGTGGGLGAAGGGRAPRPTPATRAVALCPLGRHLAAATTEGVLLFVDDPGTRFDPGDLGEDVTPAAARAALAGGNPVLAARLALRLGDTPLLEAALLGTAPRDMGAAARALPPECAPGVLAALAGLLPRVPHAEHGLVWARALLAVHARALRAAPRSATAPALRAISAAASAMASDLGASAAANVRTLEYLATAPLEEGEDKEGGGGGGGGVVGRAVAAGV